MILPTDQDNLQLGRMGPKPNMTVVLVRIERDMDTAERTV